MWKHDDGYPDRQLERQDVCLNAAFMCSNDCVAEPSHNEVVVGKHHHSKHGHSHGHSPFAPAVTQWHPSHHAFPPSHPSQRKELLIASVEVLNAEGLPIARPWYENGDSVTGTGESPKAYVEMFVELPEHEGDGEKFERLSGYMTTSAVSAHIARDPVWNETLKGRVEMAGRDLRHASIHLRVYDQVGDLKDSEVDECRGWCSLGLSEHPQHTPHDSEPLRIQLSGPADMDWWKPGDKPTFGWLLVRLNWTWQDLQALDDAADEVHLDRKPANVLMADIPEELVVFGNRKEESFKEQAQKKKIAREYDELIQFEQSYEHSMPSQREKDNDNEGGYCHRKRTDRNCTMPAERLFRDCLQGPVHESRKPEKPEKRRDRMICL